MRFKVISCWFPKFLFQIGQRVPLRHGDGGAALRPPENSLAFDKTWRRACKTAGERWTYLGLISPEKAKGIFKVEITGTALGEIIVALGEGYTGYVDGSGEGSSSADAEAGAGAEGAEGSWGGSGGGSSKAEVGAAVVALMRALSDAGRFSLASKLLPPKVKKSLDALVAALVEGGGLVAGVEADLKAAYGVK